jgi:hypothetical protein
MTSSLTLEGDIGSWSNEVECNNIEGGDEGVRLEKMTQQEGVRNLDEDWTGKSGTAERRKLQNRIHQRAFRMLYLRGNVIFSCCISWWFGND